LYGFDGNSHNSRNTTLSCINFETGEPAWTQRGLGCGSLLIADGKLLVLSEKGELVMAKASPEVWTELARSPFLEGRCWTVPVLANGRLYGRNADGKLVCVSLPKTNVLR
jgi:outer membrane protein assembly factor BamB